MCDCICDTSVAAKDGKGPLAGASPGLTHPPSPNDHLPSGAHSRQRWPLAELPNSGRYIISYPIIWSEETITNFVHINVYDLVYSICSSKEAR